MFDGEFVPLGRVVKTHGAKGELSVKLETGVTAIPQDIEVWFVPPPQGVRSGRVLGVRRGPKGPLVRVSGIDDIDTAHTLMGCAIKARPEDVPRSDRPRESDMTGILVTDVERGELGMVSEVIHTGANDVWVLPETPYGEVLVPVIDEVVIEIDVGERTCMVRLLPGLLDED